MPLNVHTAAPQGLHVSHMTAALSPPEQLPLQRICGFPFPKGERQHKLGKRVLTA